MALAYTVTLLADHKGMTLPKVVGDEYDIAVKVEINATGGYESSTSFALMFTTMSTGTTLSNDANGGSVRVRVWGNL